MLTFFSSTKTWKQWQYTLDVPPLNFLETTHAHSFAIFSSLAAKTPLSDAVKSMTADLLAAAADLASGVAVAADDVVVLFAGMVASVVAAVVLSSALVGTMAAVVVGLASLVGTVAAVVVGLALVFVGTVVVIGSRVVVIAAAGATGANSGSSGAEGARVPWGGGSALMSSDAAVGDAIAGKMVAAAVPTGGGDLSDSAIVVVSWKIL